MRVTSEGSKMSSSRLSGTQKLKSNSLTISKLQHHLRLRLQAQVKAQAHKKNKKMELSHCLTV